MGLQVLLAGVVTMVLAVPAVGADRPLPAAARDADFGHEVTPLLRAHCLRCHAGARAKGGLRLDTRAHLMAGADSGPVVVVGKSGESRLIRVIAGASADGIVMPPKGAKLTAVEVGRLRAWIDRGAPWPEGVTLSPPATAEVTHWAFQPVRKPPVPAVRRDGWVRNPIDRFVLARLEKEGIEPSSEADRTTLIRRLSFDFIGLPPTPAEVEAFVSDSRPDAYERLVDRLLASPHYGEKWARTWLDLCHYADTDGYLTDQPRPVAWRYRDWLLRALNHDLPYNQFTIEQLAGDLLPGATQDQRIATGFLRNTLSNREGGADLEEYRVEQVVDRIQMVGATWLGLTVGCARCHDHKYDPLTQREFFRLYAFFDNADEVNFDAPLPGEEAPYQARKPAYDRERAALLRPKAKEIAELQDRWEQRLRQAASHPGEDYLWDRQWEVLGLIWGGHLGEGQLEGTKIVLLDPARRTQDQKDRLLDYFLGQGSLIDPKRFADLKLAELAGKLEKLKATLPKRTRAPAMCDAVNPQPTHLHVRGEFRNHGPQVTSGVPSFLPTLSAGAPANRLALARWLVSPGHPLTARVTVNRAWQELFGQGLVRTTDNFGSQGEPPSHPDLLDWLVAEFRDGDWSQKRLHRLLVMSATYRQASRPRPELESRDPGNRLLARQASLRLSADQVRDVALAVSGLLHDAVGGPSVFPPQPESVAREAFDNAWQASSGRDRYRRGLYTYLQRTSPFALGVTFDAPPLSRSCTRRERSNTPLQALTLLNDAVFVEAATALAHRLLRDGPRSVGDRIEWAFRRCLARAPTTAERDRLAAYFRDESVAFARDRKTAAKLWPHTLAGVETAEGAAWVGTCSVLLNLHELITRD